MFTGIIQEIGKVSGLSKKGGGVCLKIAANLAANEIDLGDSISINGVCQTVISKKSDSFKVEAVEETLKKTTIGKFKAGNHVNLELPVQLNQRLGGHLILGHVDCIGKITEINKRKNSRYFAIRYPRQFSKYLIPVGSIAIDGVSLTIAELVNDHFRVSIIPYTVNHTIFKFYKVNDNVNIEFDLIGKYIDRFQQIINVKKSLLTEHDLLESGY